MLYLRTDRDLGSSSLRLVGTGALKHVV